MTFLLILFLILSIHLVRVYSLLDQFLCSPVGEFLHCCFGVSACSNLLLEIKFYLHLSTYLVSLCVEPLL